MLISNEKSSEKKYGRLRDIRLPIRGTVPLPQPLRRIADRFGARSVPAFTQ